jgi:trk system potassium uptake protein TrkH
MIFQHKLLVESYLNLLLRVLSFLSVILALFHFGFNLTPNQQYTLVIAVRFIVIAFIVQEILRWFIMTEPLWKFLRSRWSETFILLLLIVSYLQRDTLSQMSEVLMPGFRAEDLLLSYLFVTQAVVAYGQIIQFLRESNILSKIPLGPSQLFVAGFAIPIALGTLLLKLPAAAYVPINWIDALFMATSAFCVTGLTVFPINEVLTPTGLVILAGLIQLGGLGIMTLTMGLSVFFGGRLSVRERMYLGDLLAEERMGEVVKLLRKITYVTLFLEVAGGLAREDLCQLQTLSLL